MGDCDLLQLSEKQKFSFIHIVFKEDAEKFYFDELSKVTQRGELVKTLNKRYNSEARTRAITDDLRSIQLTE